jgi:tRNA (cmo5U34)-methyltransferase
LKPADIAVGGLHPFLHHVEHMLWHLVAVSLPFSNLARHRSGDQVFSYIEREDSPRPLTFQFDALRRAGFVQVEVLHKKSCFAAFGGVKS